MSGSDTILGLKKPVFVLLAIVFAVFAVAVAFFLNEGRCEARASHYAALSKVEGLDQTFDFSSMSREQMDYVNLQLAEKITPGSQSAALAVREAERRLEAEWLVANCSADYLRAAMRVNEALPR